MIPHKLVIIITFKIYNKVIVRVNYLSFIYIHNAGDISTFKLYMFLKNFAILVTVHIL